MTLGEWGKKASTFIKNHKGELKKAMREPIIVNVGTESERVYPVNITVTRDDKIATVHAYVTMNELDQIISNPNISFEVED